MEVQEAKKSAAPIKTDLIHAVCWSTGEIEFTQDIPEGAAVLASGPHDELVELIDNTCTVGAIATPLHNKRLVPGGLPGAIEYRRPVQVMEDLLCYLAWLGKTELPRGVSVRSPAAQGARHG